MTGFRVLDIPSLYLPRRWAKEAQGSGVDTNCRRQEKNQHRDLAVPSRKRRGGCRLQQCFKKNYPKFITKSIEGRQDHLIVPLKKRPHLVVGLGFGIQKQNMLGYLYCLPDNFKLILV